MKQRIISAIVFGMIFIPLVILGQLPFVLLVYTVATIALFELLRMRQLSLFSIPGIISMITLWIFMLPEHMHGLLMHVKYTKIEFLIIAVLLLLTYTVATKNRFTFDDVSFTALAILYVGMGFYYFIEIRQTHLFYIFYSLFIVWATDSGAYFIGRAIGKQKLWPDISPNKTVEGFIGGIVCALVVAFLFDWLAPIEIPLVRLLIVTVFLSIFGQVGDLAESALKRHYQVKDSGKIMPGHGGILDRFDSLLFVWPVLYFILLP